MAVIRFISSTTSGSRFAPSTMRISGPGRAAALVAEGGDRMLLRFKPVESSRAGDVARWAEIDRDGTSPLLLEAGEGQPEFTLTVYLHASFTNVQADLSKLRRMAAAGEKVSISGLGNPAHGVWHITDLSENHLDRERGIPIEAEASLVLKAVREPELRITRKVGKPRARRPRRKKKRRIHVVVKGDTLWALATKTYGDPYRWKDIAKANGVTDPRTLQIGTRLRLPS